jgi:hypothetical protein
MLTSIDLNLTGIMVMNWDAIGALAELAGAVGVIITLVYLAVQIRQSSSLVAQNNKLLDVSVANSIRDAQNELSRILACDQAVAGIFWKGLADRSSLSDEERQQFDSLMYLQFSGAQQGLATTSEETMLSLRWTLKNAGARHWWEEYESLFTKPMQEFVRELSRD